MTIDAELETDLAASLADDATEIEKMTAVHERAIATYEQRIVDARRQAKESLAKLADERLKCEAEVRRFETELRRLNQVETDVRATAGQMIASAARLAQASRTALEVLAS